MEQNKTQPVKGRRNALSWIAAVLAMIFFAPVSFAQNGEAIFKQNCTACHTIGKGKLVGPDLKGVNTKRAEAWILKFVKSSQSFIKSGDADAKAIFDQFNIIMPDQNLSDADIKAIITYIASQSPAEDKVTETASADTKTAAPEPEIKKAADATPEQILMGQHLFTGEQSLSNGGPACISCHNVNNDKVMTGGVLAKDLTNAFTRIGGEMGLGGILNAPPFPAMTQAYKDRQITEEEIYALTAFLNTVDKDSMYQHPSSGRFLLYSGLVALAVLLLLISIIWYGRKRRTVKEAIYNRQVKSI